MLDSLAPTVALIACALTIGACSSSDAANDDLPAGAGGPATAGASADPIEDAILAAHNSARAAVSPAPASPIAPLSWSPDVAAAARAWADGCQFKHSGGKYGENIYASAGASTMANDVVASWVSEAKDYDYGANSCTATCGHYTQVVWQKSTTLGCAVRNCSTNSPFKGFSQWQFWVCNYDPPGNFNGQRPY
jgi:pathogenesis-related protein 1